MSDFDLTRRNERRRTPLMRSWVNRGKKKDSRSLEMPRSSLLLAVRRG